MAQNVQQGGLQQIPRREPVFEIVPAVEPLLECDKPLLPHLHRDRPAGRRPRLAGVGEVEHTQLHEPGFD